MFKVNHFYTHKSMLDVCFRVIKKQFSDEKRVKIKVSWYLKKALVPMGLSETLDIKRPDIKNWNELKNDVT